MAGTSPVNQHRAVRRFFGALLADLKAAARLATGRAMVAFNLRYQTRRRSRVNANVGQIFPAEYQHPGRVPKIGGLNQRHVDRKVLRTYSARLS